MKWNDAYSSFQKKKKLKLRCIRALIIVKYAYCRQKFLHQTDVIALLNEVITYVEAY